MSLLGAVKILDDKRLASRERNKMHARKTRQRKKEHMNQLEGRVQTLKQRQVNVKLLIKEKNTANILLGMVSNFSDNNAASSTVDPKIDELLKRSTDDIPDSSKIPDLPALILPGNHNKRRRLDSSSVSSNVQQEYPNDGIDYELLGKDRTACTPEELDKIRKERNRMHAKRTRDRKRIFMEEMEKIIKQLEAENGLLEQHLSAITADSVISSTPSSGRATPSLNSPVQKSSCPAVKPPTQMLQIDDESTSENQLQKKEIAPQEITQQNVTKENISSSKANITSEISTPQHNTVKVLKDSTLPRTMLTSSEISTVSMSPTPHENQDVSHTSSPVVRKPTPEPLQLPVSITTTSDTQLRWK